MTASIEIDWPSGIVERIGNVAANQFLTVDEARGVTSRSGPATGARYY